MLSDEYSVLFESEPNIIHVISVPLPTSWSSIFVCHCVCKLKNRDLGTRLWLVGFCLSDVKVEVIMSFNKVKSLTTDVSLVVRAMKNSSLLEVTLPL